ncbi:Metallo-dependent phosphatase, partial [Byssothecium circinans]
MATTKFLILSDTHGKWPYEPPTSAPKADVFLHCGDLTQVGGLASFKRALADIKSISAELKLLIAGNHDLELDEEWVRRNSTDEEDLDLDDSRECVAYMKSLTSSGIYYLEEGTHDFELSDGRKFTVYASPYTPEFNGYAFAYGAGEDRFNEGGGIMPSGGVDVVMTHGPPLFKEVAAYTLDLNNDGVHCGSENLAKAVQRVKPRLHCFGHIHEGRGAARVTWGD